MLKALGFSRNQVRAMIVWQATTLATVGLVLGIPLGVTVGRLLWHLVADGLGVANTVTIPSLALVSTILAALTLVNLTAFFPARAGAQIRPAVALRSEEPEGARNASPTCS